jgi:acyl dehydratase
MAVDAASSAGPTYTLVERPADLLGLVGSTVGVSPWVEVTQADIDLFARLTHDEQWIHVDRQRAAKGPFGTTIAHGYFVLSLCSYFGGETLKVRSHSAGINYGLDRVRFISPVPVGSRLRGKADVEEVTEVAGGVQLRLAITAVREGAAKPVCVATTISRIFD